MGNGRGNGFPQRGRGGRGGRGASNGVGPQTTLPFRPHPNGGEQQTDGSYRGGRGRGRGGMARTRGGYIPVDPNPDAGVVKHNPNFRAQNYSQVPPPKNLNSRGGRGGRGNPRGSHRGRGASTGNNQA